MSGDDYEVPEELRALMAEAVAGFDVAGLVRRARRVADLNQRELAAVLGVSQSTVARMERGGRVAVEAFVRLLAVAGMRLAVVDASGDEVAPMSADGVRTNGGSRFPAHLDVLPPDLVPAERRHFPRYDRPPATGWYHLRPRRDRLRRASGVPADHPTVQELARRRWELSSHGRWAARIAQTARLRGGASPGTVSRWASERPWGT